jgi:hypothetical protein
MKTIPKLAAPLIGAAALPATLTSCVVDARQPPQTTMVESIHTPGYVVPALPTGYSTVTHRGVRYYQAGGVYYRPTTSGYTVVTSPF